MDDLVTRIPGATNPGVNRIESENFNPDPERGKRQPGRKQKGREGEEPEEAPDPKAHKMDIRV